MWGRPLLSSQEQQQLTSHNNINGIALTISKPHQSSFSVLAAPSAAPRSKQPWSGDNNGHPCCLMQGATAQEAVVTSWNWGGDNPHRDLTITISCLSTIIVVAFTQKMIFFFSISLIYTTKDCGILHSEVLNLLIPFPAGCRLISFNQITYQSPYSLWKTHKYWGPE